MNGYDLPRRLAAEFLGAWLLVATVVGSGIMAEALADGNAAVALIGNTAATGAILVVLIAIFGPVSGAHFNPAVSLVMLCLRELPLPVFVCYVAVQIAGAIAGTVTAHAMFELPILQLSQHARDGFGPYVSEIVATFGLIATILACRKFRPGMIPGAVGCYIMAGYWFTASTCFANPAVAIARSLTDTFAGIRPSDVPYFIVAEFVGAAIGLLVLRWLLRMAADAPAVVSPRAQQQQQQQQIGAGDER